MSAVALFWKIQTRVLPPAAALIRASRTWGYYVSMIANLPEARIRSILQIGRDKTDILLLVVIVREVTK
jgi:hypothetical protein